MKALFKLIVPILRYKPDIHKLLISCLPRYTARSCCADISHNVGMLDIRTVETVISDLTAMKRQLRSLLFTEKIQNVTLVDPTSWFEDLAESDFADPVHLTGDGYERMAQRIVQGADTGPADAAVAEETTPPSKKFRHSSSNRGGGQGGPAGSNFGASRGGYAYRGGSSGPGRRGARGGSKFSF